ncbi:MAG: galactokinase family protein [Eubacteriales bacterium]|nr:galactokinase family protein [Eubacteriales bacterium]
MNQYAQMIRMLKMPEVMKRLTHLYGQRDGMLVSQTARYTRILKRHEELVNAGGTLTLVSAPGRTEIGGNHTDHNRGKVLAAAINLDTLAAVSKRADDKVRIFSEGYDPLEMSLSDLQVHENEKGTTASLVRGVAAGLKEHGFTIGGFDAVVTSTVRSGSGLSSSAAFEVLACAIFDSLYNGWRLEPKLRAQISQHAENVYFGKPSGLMDQMASSVGGLTFIDFKNDDPKIKPLSYDFAQKGVALVVVNTGGSHDDLTADYAAMPQEMRAVAGCFGETCLRPVRPEQFMQNIPMIREKLGKENDRAILRAQHYFTENRRVTDMVDALEHDDLNAFYENIISSGYSSFLYLQNVYADPAHQELSLALMMAETRLRGKGAWRVHGGGFAGTTLNFVPQKELASFVKTMEAVFGAHSCNVLDIRPEGAAYIDLGKI